MCEEGVWRDVNLNANFGVDEEEGVGQGGARAEAKRLGNGECKEGSGFVFWWNGGGTKTSRRSE